MNRAFQPHESHVPFLLQFKARGGDLALSTCSPGKCFSAEHLVEAELPAMQDFHILQGCAACDCCMCMQIDFNLYGMGLLRLGHVLFRHPVPTAQHTRHGWAESPVLAVPEGQFLNQSSLWLVL